MDVSVILTYRCNSRCSMCYIWQNPTLPREEVSLSSLGKIPHGVDYLNLTGGEPTIREDLEDIVELLYHKAKTLEISSNGTHPERLEPIIKRHPDVKVRFSLEGIGETNDRIRGERGGFERKVQGLIRLKELGGTDLGFAITIQDDNARQLIEVFRLAKRHGFELATSSIHNGYQFHKADNVLYDRPGVAREIEGLITEMLKTNKVKNWFRAYLNLGLIRKVLGQPRLLKCTAATDFVFIDPWSDVYACNVRPDLKLGNLERNSWEELLNGVRASEIWKSVDACQQNCWMVGSAKTAMRNRRYSNLPRWAPLRWVLANKARVTLGFQIPFERFVDYSAANRDPVAPLRPFFIEQKGVKRNMHRAQGPEYERFGEFFNR